MNLPNKITLGRFLASLILFILLVIMNAQGDPGWLFPLISMVLFILVVATDALDGYYARKLNLITDFGRIADPVVDKVMICGTFVLLASSSWARELMPAWIVVLIIAREFLVTGIRGYIESRGIAFGASWAGKGKMISQCVAVPAVFLHQIVRGAFPDTKWLITTLYFLAFAIVIGTLFFTLYSGYLYISKAAKILKDDEGI